MDDTLARIWEHLVGRFTGPLTFRLLLQPIMSTLFAVRDGLRDSRAGLRAPRPRQSHRQSVGSPTGAGIRPEISPDS